MMGNSSWAQDFSTLPLQGMLSGPRALPSMQQQCCRCTSSVNELGLPGRVAGVFLAISQSHMRWPRCQTGHKISWVPWWIAQGLYYRWVGSGFGTSQFINFLKCLPGVHVSKFCFQLVFVFEFSFQDLVFNFFLSFSASPSHSSSMHFLQAVF